MNDVKVLFASASEPVNRMIADRFREIHPELPLVVVSEFPLLDAEWVQYRIERGIEDNRALLQERLAGRTPRLTAIILEPRIPHWPMRRLGASIAPLRCLFFNETGTHFMLRPRSIPNILRHGLWRTKNFIRVHTGPKSALRRLLRGDVALPLLYRRALANGRKLAGTQASASEPPVSPAKARVTPGISVVIPSRNGRDLLSSCLPTIGDADEIIVIDNGSADGTAEWLTGRAIVEHSPEPLPFAIAVNRGIRRARYSHVCVLNNDMVCEPGFLAALRRPFDQIPGLFCASAQIFFPEGRRREETGKTVWNNQAGPTDFPVRCDIPLDGEDLTYVLYGSGGCSLYDAAKLEALGGFDEAYVPAYVEDLDLGMRAWLRGWPSVYAAHARVLHQHRATTSRYFTPAQLDLALETNFIRFLARCLPDPLFTRWWQHNSLRLKALEKTQALRTAATIPLPQRAPGDWPLATVFDLCNGDVSVFPGREPAGKPRVLVASPYLPFPLSHGAAVRIYNLMREGARDFDQVLLAFVEDPGPVPRELLDICVEVVTVYRPGTHAPPQRGRPDTVEEFDTPAFHAALRQAIAKWQPGVVQLEFTQMALYAPDCAPARTILVEHDITYDLYKQMLANPATNTLEIRRQHDLWVTFETAAWKQVDRVVTMSDQDGALVEHSVAIPNGVDLDRFRPSLEPAADSHDPRRLLFIGSFGHRPNVLALEFFLRDVFPLLENVTLHVIAGRNHTRFWDLQYPGVEVEGFVSDVRPAYRRATLVIAPLVASAGTNIKVVEAMAMGKAVVSTNAGIHGLPLAPGRDIIVANAPRAMADEIRRLLADPTLRREVEIAARTTAERDYGWRAISERQRELYNFLAKMA